MTRHHYGISAVVPLTSSRGETSGGVAKSRLLSQASETDAFIYWYACRISWGSKTFEPNSKSRKRLGRLEEVARSRFNKQILRISVSIRLSSLHHSHWRSASKNVHYHTKNLSSTSARRQFAQNYSMFFLSFFKPNKGEYAWKDSDCTCGSASLSSYWKLHTEYLNVQRRDLCGSFHSNTIIEISKAIFTLYEHLSNTSLTTVELCIAQVFILRATRRSLKELETVAAQLCSVTAMALKSPFLHISNNQRLRSARYNDRKSKSFCSNAVLTLSRSPSECWLHTFDAMCNNNLRIRMEGSSCRPQ